uniref:Alpha-tubulin N-acetyltransferase n=1 Tax=Romanomermis culicivorax TaxID=13658 RepID=A0A915K944_ROMCU
MQIGAAENWSGVLNNTSNIQPKFALLVDQLGKLSAEAQNLKHVLTSSKKLCDSPGNQVIYILWTQGNSASNSILLGYLKCAPRCLYFYDDQNRCKMYEPLCLLDFYVHANFQRRGYGKIMFDAMLQGENVKPEMIAIDKPSDILLRFLSKYYQLKDPLWQSNNFVVFHGFFNGSKAQTGLATFSDVESPSKVNTEYENSYKDTIIALMPPANVEMQSKTLPAHGDIKQQIDNSYNNVSKGRLIKSLGHHKLW